MLEKTYKLCKNYHSVSGTVTVFGRIYEFKNFHISHPLLILEDDDEKWVNEVTEIMENIFECIEQICDLGITTLMDHALYYNEIYMKNHPCMFFQRKKYIHMQACKLVIVMNIGFSSSIKIPQIPFLEKIYK